MEAAVKERFLDMDTRTETFLKPDRTFGGDGTGNTSDDLRGAVVGLGSMGSNHARVLSRMKEVCLVAGVDSSKERIEEARRKFPALQLYTDLQSMLQAIQPDFVVISTPTTTHFALTEIALISGSHCLVEKPLTVDPDEGLALAHLAEKRDLQLAVGHIERFNPAMLQLRRRLKRGEGGQILQLSARRTGPFPSRITDVGVIRDLAIHDIDVMLTLSNAPVSWVHAETAQHLHQHCEDLFVGTLRFQSGIVGLLEVNWLTPFKKRELEVVCTGGTYVANYLTQELTFHQNGHPNQSGHEKDEWQTLQTFTGISEGQVVSYEVGRAEPLRIELECFVSAILHGTSGCVNAEDAANAASITAAFMESASRGQSVRLEAPRSSAVRHGVSGTALCESG
jgi:predicted dehydrogenase